MINDSFRVILNGKPAKLFRSGSFTALNLLMMNGYGFRDIMGRPGGNIAVTVNGQRKVFYGTASEPASLSINGKEGKLSQIIQAGDSIDFVPAKAGVPAKAYLGDIEGAATCREITLNGEYAFLETPLKNGDVIVIKLANEENEEEEEKKEDKIQRKEKNGPEEKAAIKVAEEEQKTDGRRVSVPVERETAEALGRETVQKQQERSIQWQETEPAEKKEMESYQQEKVPAKQEETELGHQKAKLRKLLFYLNDSLITLPQKEDGSPYYLMDMIEYSGIDLKNPQGNIRLTVNKSQAMFQQALSEGDRIEIMVEKRTS